MISVVLPVYNGERFLKQAINSILNQTYQDLELVIVNDCSTDGSVQIVQEFMEKDSRVRLINNETNQKLPASLNIGFSHCKGEYYTWTSDDNILLPNSLEILLNTLVETSSDLVFSRCETIDPQGKKLGETTVYTDLNELFYNNIVLASFLYKKEIHEALNGYDTTKFLVEDYDFWLRAYRSFRFTFVPQILYQIRYHGNNLGVKHLENVKLRKIALLKDNMVYAKDPKTLDGIHREIASCYYEAANSYYNKLTVPANKKMILSYRLKDLIKKILGK